MFQVGFGELVVVAIVALFVLGPERLPQVAKLCGRLVTRSKNALNLLRDEFERHKN